MVKVNTDEIKYIFNKVANGLETDDDLEVLKSGLTSDQEITVQVGKTNVVIGQGKDIHIGDRIFKHGVDIETVLEAFKEALPSISNSGWRTVSTQTAEIAANGLEFGHGLELRQLADELLQLSLEPSSIKDNLIKDPLLMSRRNDFREAVNLLQEATTENVSSEYMSDTYLKAKEALHRVLKTFSEDEDIALRAIIEYCLGICMIVLGENTVAVEYFKKSYSKATKSINKQMLYVSVVYNKKSTAFIGEALKDSKQVILRLLSIDQKSIKENLRFFDFKNRKNKLLKKEHGDDERFSSIRSSLTVALSTAFNTSVSLAGGILGATAIGPGFIALTILSIVSVTGCGVWSIYEIRRIMKDVENLSKIKKISTIGVICSIEHISSEIGNSDLECMEHTEHLENWWRRFHEGPLEGVWLLDSYVPGSPSDQQYLEVQKIEWDAI